jgi:hypothetical protein
VVVLGLNLSPGQSVNLSLPMAARKRSWYVRSALAGSASAAVALRASSVALKAAGSWRTLRLDGTAEDPTLPAVEGVLEAAEAAMLLEPQSYAFTVLSGLAPGACGAKES